MVCDNIAFMPSSELISKLRWKFPVVFVRTCSTELLRPEESTCVRDPQNLFLNQRFAALSLFTRFAPSPHLRFSIPVVSVVLKELLFPLRIAFVVPQVLSLTLELYLSASVKCWLSSAHLKMKVLWIFFGLQLLVL